VIRYAERTREPVLVADATRDDRFSRDAYLRASIGVAAVVPSPDEPSPSSPTSPCTAPSVVDVTR